ncbi:SDR family oxidoreductase [Novosphingobium sp.]|uniref:SDR family oxidoreductase n=1 Tax=Novosphingobium sp. TaxID=1874826 RepID=UPI0026330079|nr:SDR family oxidoreductase [Novosphingobium sp.]
MYGKTAIVTGAGQGIGRASAERFAREGARVLAVDVNSVALASLEKACACESFAFDLTDAPAAEAFARAAGPVDVVFLCAGTVPYGTVLECSDADWDQAFALNVTAMFRMIRALLPGMIARGGGSIITMSSVASSVRGVPDRFAYATTKAAIIGMTKALAADHAAQGIRANAICPGTIETSALEARMQASGDYAKTRATFAARQPLGRFGQADEIASLVLYLASDAARFTTGQCHIIDGGWSN